MGSKVKKQILFLWKKKFFYYFILQIIHILSGISIWTTTTTEGLDNINKSSVVLDSSLGTSGLLLFLLLFLHFGCLSLHFAGTSQGTVHFTTQQWNGHVQFEAGQAAHGGVVG